jgi:hypothetical protein
VVSKLAITDAIRAASPEWQYMDATQRDQVIDKKAVAYSGKRRDYVSFLRSKRAMDMFDGAVRVVFSFGGFQTKTVQMVEALNAGARRTRPLVLCHIPATMRSADAAVEAMDDDAEYSPAPHPTDATMTRSQAILEGKTISDVGPAASSSALQSLPVAATSARCSLCLLHAGSPHGHRSRSACVARCCHTRCR